MRESQARPGPSGPSPKRAHTLRDELIDMATWGRRAQRPCTATRSERGRDSDVPRATCSNIEPRDSEPEPETRQMLFCVCIATVNEA